MPCLDVPGGQLYYETAGENQLDHLPLVFIHAGIATLHMWDNQLPAFVSDRLIVRYDTRGFGQTATEDVSFSDRDDLLALLDHLGLKQVVVIGCSRGGQIALEFTLEHPERVGALVTVCAAPGGLDFEMPPEQDARFAEMYKLWQTDPKGEAMRELKLRTWIDGFHRQPAEVDTTFRERVRAMLIEDDQVENSGKPIELDPSSVGRLKEIQTPTLVVVGAVDNAYVLYAGDVMAKEIAGARKVVIENASHLPSMERPVEFNQALRDFLVEVE